MTVAGVSVDWTASSPLVEALLLEDELPSVVPLSEEVLPLVVPKLWSRAEDAVDGVGVVVVVVFAVALACPIGPT